MPTGRMSRGKRLMGFEPTTFCMANASRNAHLMSASRGSKRKGAR
jgi:hypothetical protein